MTYLSGTRVLKVGRSRLFDPMHKGLVIIDGIGIAIQTFLYGQVSKSTHARAICKHFPLAVRFPFASPTVGMIYGAPMREIAFEFIPDTSKSGAVSEEDRIISKYGLLVLEAITPIYVSFFERHRRWIRTNCGQQSYLWPSILEFSRMIRNSISHHDGHVHFDNPEAPGVTWHHLTYAPADEGKKVIGTDIQLAEMIMLMFEVGDELDRLGCPLSP